jgi:hypothetical protein
MGMQRISKGLFLGGIAAGLGLANLLSIIGRIIAMGDDPQAAAPLFGIALLPMIFGLVLFAILIYKMWAAIQDGQAHATPGQAVGFTFIPFYNFYWIFVAIWGFAKDYNAYLKRHALSLPALPEALFLAYCIFTMAGIVISFIPVINILFSIAGFIILMMIVAAVCNGVNALPETLPPVQPVTES